MTVGCLLGTASIEWPTPPPEVLEVTQEAGSTAPLPSPRLRATPSSHFIRSRHSNEPTGTGTSVASI